MMDKPISTQRRQTLDQLLRVLVDAWGYTAVVEHLGRLKETAEEKAAQSNESTRRTTRRRSAQAYVEKFDLPPHKKSMMLELASRFENRSFLPTISDVRFFLERKNVDLGKIKSRKGAIPKILAVLMTLPDENLQKILRDENYSGPSSLGPLSEAIKMRGSLIRSGS